MNKEIYCFSIICSRAFDKSTKNANRLCNSKNIDEQNRFLVPLCKKESFSRAILFFIVSDWSIYQSPGLYRHK